MDSNGKGQSESWDSFLNKKLANLPRFLLFQKKNGIDTYSAKGGKKKERLNSHSMCNQCGFGLRKWHNHSIIQIQMLIALRNFGFPLFQFLFLRSSGVFSWIPVSPTAQTHLRNLFHTQEMKKAKMLSISAVARFFEINFIES